VIDQLIDFIPKNKTLVEIGAGPGNFTRHLLPIAKRVIAIEIDEKFKPELNKLALQYQNLEVIFDNAVNILKKSNFVNLVKVDKNNVWLVGNLPYHIVEPLFMQIFKIDIGGCVFLIGGRLADRIHLKKENSRFGKLTILINTFYHFDFKGYIYKNNFYPPPKTTSAIIVLEPRKRSEFIQNKSKFIWKYLFTSSPHGPLIKNAIRKGLIKYNNKRGEKLTKNQARKIIKNLKIPKTISDKSLEQLNNEELNKLFLLLKDIEQLSKKG
jgi:16S rRNA (adenine1518-N6/adenine1519-N6)-dimethyltransferase